MVARNKYWMIHTVVRDIPHTVYMVTEDDHGTVLRFWADEPVAVHLPAGLPTGVRVEWIQQGKGSVTFLPAEGCYIQSIFGANQSLARFASGRVLCVNSRGYWNLSGEVFPAPPEPASETVSEITQEAAEPPVEEMNPDAPEDRRSLLPGFLIDFLSRFRRTT